MNDPEKPTEPVVIYATATLQATTDPTNVKEQD